MGALHRPLTLLQDTKKHGRRLMACIEAKNEVMDSFQPRALLFEPNERTVQYWSPGKLGRKYAVWSPGKLGRKVFLETNSVWPTDVHVVLVAVLSQK